jgi:hypothetical protein
MGRTKTVRMRLALGVGLVLLLAFGAVEHPIARARAEMQLRRRAEPKSVLRFAQEHVYAGQLVCGYLDLRETSPGLRRRRFTLDLNDGAAWIEGVRDATPNRWLYREMRRRVWSRCMGVASAPT